MALDYPFDMLVVDDDSPDGTAQLVEALQTNTKTVYTWKRQKKKAWVLLMLRHFDGHWIEIISIYLKWMLIFYDPYDLTKLYEILQQDKADVVVGSRYVRGIQVINWPMSRILLSYFASLYVRLITQIPIKDTTAGFVGYKKEVIQTIIQENIRFSGYAFQIEMKFKAWVKNFRLKEIPVVFTDRTRGVSKMNRSIISEAIFGIILMKIKSWYAK